MGAAGEGLDLALARHFAAQFAAQQSKPGKPALAPADLKARVGKRLVAACREAKHALSLNDRAKFMVDAMGADGDDARFEVTRDEMVQLICKPQFDALRGALAATLAASFPDGSGGDASVGASSAAAAAAVQQQQQLTRGMLRKVELVGGGSRSLAVQAIVAEALGLDADKQLSYTLDVALAPSLGAAVLAASAVTAAAAAAKEEEEEEEEKEETKNRQEEEALRAQEGTWAAQDAAMRRQHAQRAQLEAFISATRASVSESEASSALAEERLDGAAVLPLLDTAEELTWAAWAPDLADRCEAARVELDRSIRALCPGYFAKKEAARAA